MERQQPAGSCVDKITVLLQDEGFSKRFKNRRVWKPALHSQRM